ncbi:hypothetical protein KIH86_25650 [Paenibacillus sp. HN-1]|uniref:hypothetical protein n=1 Tax=Paenibacillus TaxID=44249 RepID=UPI001CA950E8|nr:MULTISPECIES: hypothetical protein [Paenibacillus]MBY9081305.1 hypothetical protein [Paenibacillus sp. CGMCC 1.18879]MBY9087578.1 hypothetical protein [Paenibacillus sinensis]
MNNKFSLIIPRLLTAMLLAAGLLFTYPSPAAHANVFNDMYKGLEQFSELPDQVNELKDSYQQTLNELDQTKSQLENYRSENVTLQEKNQQLTKMLDELRDERADRERYIRRLKVTALTGLGLVAGYFILTRLIRFGMRSRSGRRDQWR